MPLIRRDNNELRYNAIWLLPKQQNPDYYLMLFKNSKALFYGVNREDLVRDLDLIIHHKIEKVMGVSIHNLLLTYKNLPYLNSFTRSKNSQYASLNIYKYTIMGWLDEIEQWVFKRCVEIEPNIRFNAPPIKYV